MRKFNRPNNNRQRFGDGNRRPRFTRPVREIPSDPSKVDTEQVLKSFTNLTVRAFANEDNDHLIKRFKRMVEGAGVLSEIKKREHYKSPGQKRRERQLKSIKNARKKKARQERFDSHYDDKKVSFRPRPQDQRNQQASRPVVDKK